WQIIAPAKTALNWAAKARHRKSNPENDPERLHGDHGIDPQRSDDGAWHRQGVRRSASARRRILRCRVGRDLGPDRAEWCGKEDIPGIYARSVPRRGGGGRMGGLA